MSFNLLNHGDPRNRQIKVGSGQTCTKPEKYCARHGWLDAFLWKHHETCNQKPITGAEIEQPKTLAKAA